METKDDSGIIVRTNAKAFAGERSAKPHQFLVDYDGTVRVWDDIAGHYTRTRSRGRFRMISAISCADCQSITQFLSTLAAPCSQNRLQKPVNAYLHAVPLN